MRPERFHKPRKARTSKMRLNFTANNFVFGRIHRKNASTTFFYKVCKAKTSKMRLNFTASRFIFEHINRGISPITFSVNLAGRELLKCVGTSRQTASFLDAKIEKMHPELCS